ncbi:Pyruvate dehydrogenase phosphatase regulatory subunit, mitochondrial [Nymphon striatum]|nr:Pyruvate dehydrogenase phosphatase regulatory subunit, mitochondrial [Nymphon striatum]
MTWMGMESGIDPLDWGWKLEDNQLVSIMSDMNAAPDALLKMVHCNCTTGCSGPRLINNGSLLLSTNEERTKMLMYEKEKVRANDIEATWISPQEVAKLHPFANTEHIKGAIWVPGDCVANPTDMCQVFAKLAKEKGTKVIEDCHIISAETTNGRISSVTTSDGKISCEHFVLCGGMWSHHFGLKMNPPVVIPAHASQHFYLLTKPIEGTSAKLPTIRDFDASTYIREWSGGFLCGIFEPDSLPEFGDGVPSNLRYHLFDSNWEHFGRKLEQVRQYKYLGSILDDEGKCTKDVKARIAMAKQAFMKRKELLIKNISLYLKKRLVKSLIWSVALYGSETWTIRVDERSKLEAFEMWVWRNILKIKWSDKISNEDVLKLVDEERAMMGTIHKRQRRWIGHILRSENMLRDVMEGHVMGRRQRGRQRIKMLDGMKDGKSYAELKEESQDQPYIEGIVKIVPSVENAEVQQLLNGPESFSCDGHMIIGETPQIGNMYVATAMSSNGIVQASGVGRIISELIAKEETFVDCSKVDIKRFQKHQNTANYLLDRTTEIITKGGKKGLNSGSRKDLRREGDVGRKEGIKLYQKEEEMES